MQKIAIYGAKALALGMYEAIHCLYPDIAHIGFVVSSMANNPTSLCGQKVWVLKELKKRLLPEERKSLQILVATPEDIHNEITESLLENGFPNYVCMDSHKEAKLMERYFTYMGIFPSLHGLAYGTERVSICIYQAKFHKDQQLKKNWLRPDWVVPIQVGAALTEKRVCGCCDNQGLHISEKNVNYCELTALYWIWKNRLLGSFEEAYEGLGGKDTEYYGLFHYRRILDISDEDLSRMKENAVDVVLQYPTLHEPDISEHHARYMEEADWDAMLQALSELEPDYASAFQEILKQPYFYNYNLIAAKKQVLADYCNWLFPILERTEVISEPKGWERTDRYIGYLGENLMTLYFLYHQNDLKIYHTGRLMLT